MIDRLRSIVGDAHVLTDAGVTAGYEVDWSGRFRGSTPAVVRPGTVEEVAGVIAACTETGTAIVPQGGNTGLVGGGVPMGGEVVLSLRRLDSVGPVDPVAGAVTAAAGAPLAAVQAAAAEAGWAYGVDMASRDSATVGGTIATNAGGLRVLRHGDTRAQLLGVEAVLGTGGVVRHLSGLAKDNTGYHLPALLCGSEGTLGVVTAARLRLVPPAPERVVALVAFPDIGAALEATAALRRQVATLAAAELFFAAGLDLVCDSDALAPPFPDRHGVYLLLEAAGAFDPTDELASAVAGLSGVADVAVAADGPRRAQLWRYREAHTEAINRIGPPLKFDVTLPAPVLGEFTVRVAETVHAVAAEADVWLFGHAAEGNLHVNVTGADPADLRIDDAVLTLVAEMGGSISAEHGIGTAKRKWLHLNRSEAEIAAFRAIKAALDPAGILNPNVLLP